MKHHHLGFVEGDGRGRAGLVVKQAHFAKEITVRQHGEDDLATVVRKNGDFDTAGKDHEQSVPDVVLEENHSIFGILASTGNADEACQILVFQPRKQRHLAEQLGGYHSCPPSGLGFLDARLLYASVRHVHQHSIDSSRSWRQVSRERIDRGHRLRPAHESLRLEITVLAHDEETERTPRAPRFRSAGSTRRDRENSVQNVTSPWLRDRPPGPNARGREPELRTARDGVRTPEVETCGSGTLRESRHRARGG